VEERLILKDNDSIVN